MWGQNLRRLVMVVAAVVCLPQVAAPFEAAEDAYDVLPNQVYVEREAGPLKADLYVPKGDGPFPTMIVVHGGAWASGTKAQLAGVAKGLAERGYTTAAISYRLAPQDTFPAQIYDCQAVQQALEFVARHFKDTPSDGE